MDCFCDSFGSFSMPQSAPQQQQSMQAFSMSISKKKKRQNQMLKLHKSKYLSVPNQCVFVVKKWKNAKFNLHTVEEASTVMSVAKVSWANNHWFIIANWQSI